MVGLQGEDGTEMQEGGLGLMAIVIEQGAKVEMSIGKVRVGSERPAVGLFRLLNFSHGAMVNAQMKPGNTVPGILFNGLSKQFRGALVILFALQEDAQDPIGILGYISSLRGSLQRSAGYRSVVRPCINGQVADDFEPARFGLT